jgi:hypothetical protein
MTGAAAVPPLLRARDRLRSVISATLSFLSIERFCVVLGDKKYSLGPGLDAIGTAAGA